MKKAKSLGPENKLKALAQKAIEVHAMADALHKEIQTMSLEEDDIVKYTIEASDSTGYIQTILERLTDGSPRPFRHEMFDQESRKYLIGVFAQVGPRCKKYPKESAAYIDDIDFSLEELVQFRDWINSAIEWNNKF